LAPSIRFQLGIGRGDEHRKETGRAYHEQNPSAYC